MKGTSNHRRNGPVSVRGVWVALSLQFLTSTACASLSPHATKALLDLVSQLGWNAKGNGDLSAAPAVMRPRGWTSYETLKAALRELMDAKLIVMTRQGSKRRCTLYAITLWPMDCDFSKLDHGPGCYATEDWRGEREHRAEKPTLDKPAHWHSPRKGEKRRSP